MSSKHYSTKYVYPSDGNQITPEQQQELNRTRVQYNPSNPYRYTFTGTLEGKDAARQQAIIDTICYMGWMSLKDSDHAASGKDMASTKRILKEATETRKAAETLLTLGEITIVGEWSNGIRVGPGPHFAHIDHSIETQAALATYEKNQKRTRAPRTVKSAEKVVIYDLDILGNRAESGSRDAMEELAEIVRRDRNAWAEIARHFPNLVREGACEPMRYADGASCAVKMRVRVPLALMRAYHGLDDEPVADNDADAIADAAIAAITGEEYTAPTFVAPAYVAPTFVAPPMPAPTPIRPSAPYTPRVGDTVQVVYRHENGTTTNRTVDVQRVGKDLFRGYDRTYGRTRNFEYRYLASIALAGKEAIA